MSLYAALSRSFYGNDRERQRWCVNRSNEHLVQIFVEGFEVRDDSLEAVENGVGMVGRGHESVTFSLQRRKWRAKYVGLS